MEHKLSGRVTLILIVLAVGLIGIFPPNRLFNGDIPWSKKHNLKPGIDISGGTSLLYEIKAPPGGIEHRERLFLYFEFANDRLRSDPKARAATPADEVTEILRILAENTARVQRIVRAVASRLPAKRECACGSALEHAIIESDAAGYLITDKGSINQRAVLRCRAELVAALYADVPSAAVIAVPSG